MKYKIGWLVSLTIGVLMVWLIVSQILNEAPNYPRSVFIIMAVLWLAGVLLGNLYRAKLGNLAMGIEIKRMSSFDHFMWAVIIGGIAPLFLLAIPFVNNGDWSRPK